MNGESTPNPYRPLADTNASFTGRREAFARLHQYLKDAAGALVFTGWPMAGKTAFLRQFDAVFDDHQLGVYIALGEITDEAGFLHLLADETMKALAARDFTLSRVPEIPPQVEDMRSWFSDEWLPEVKSAIRQHRQMVWLIDDTQALTAAVKAGRLNADIFAYLAALLSQQNRLRLVFALDIADETSLNLMGALVQPTHVIRLGPLSRAETAALLREPVGDRYTLTEDAVDEVYHASGGQPQWVQRFGFHIFRQSSSELVTASDVKALIPAVYAQSQGELAALWRSLSDQEHLILSAVASLLHDDPLRRITSSAAAAWLLETEYPMDETSVHAAVRSLQYREILASTELTEIRVAAGLMEKWLVENARIPEKPSSGLRFGQRQLIGLAVLAIVIIILALAVSLSSTPSDTSGSDAPLPTVTLIQQTPQD